MLPCINVSLLLDIETVLFYEVHSRANNNIKQYHQIYLKAYYIYNLLININIIYTDFGPKIPETTQPRHNNKKEKKKNDKKKKGKKKEQAIKKVNKEEEEEYEQNHVEPGILFMHFFIQNFRR